MRSSRDKALHIRYAFHLHLFLSLTLLAALSSGQVFATTFDMSVTPPRFEKKVKPGKVVRDTIRITNLDNNPGRYVVKTADWELTRGGKVTYNEDAPHENSCRPWVRIERHSTTVPPGATKSYRFEVHVPSDAPAGECRFALMVSSDPRAIKPMRMGQISFPVVGRIAVIVYLAVGDAKPKLEFRGLEIREARGRLIPVVLLENVGSAHGRPFGSLTATDASGRKTELVVAQSPILSGQTRAIELQPIDWSRGDATATAFPLKPPLHIRGKISWDGGSVKLDEVLR